MAVLLSGGVDSSVALRLAKDEGHELTAFYLKIWLEDELSYLGDCPWEEDLEFAREICENAGVPLEVVSLQKEYWDIVVEYVIRELKLGHTPSPDILCNQYIKFGAFIDHIDDRYERIVSGHYAQRDESDDHVRLKRSPDDVKDQTYFLCQLSKAQLYRLHLPLGPLKKSEVRALAEQMQLPNCQRKDSQGICFLGKIRYDDFIEHHLGEERGEIRDLETDAILGEHRGFWFHTIGQRKGLGLSGGPWYVVNKDIANNIVYVSHDEHFLDQARESFEVDSLVWNGEVPDSGKYLVKLRHGPEIRDCSLKFQEGAKAKVELLEGSDTGIATGQYAVFYQDEVCLGGGVMHI